jgi:hypothetical protein
MVVAQRDDCSQKILSSRANVGRPAKRLLHSCRDETDGLEIDSALCSASCQEDCFRRWKTSVMLYCSKVKRQEQKCNASRRADRHSSIAVALHNCCKCLRTLMATILGASDGQNKWCYVWGMAVYVPESMSANNLFTHVRRCQRPSLLKVLGTSWTNNDKSRPFFTGVMVVMDASRWMW